jgi:DNA-binding MarR family transcriptional regulator
MPAATPFATPFAAPAPGAPELSELLGAVERTIQHSVDERLWRLGTSQVQWQALRAISRHPRLSQHRLARRMPQPMSDQAFAILLRRLRRQGLITRFENRERASIHELTPLGRIVLELADLVARHALAVLFVQLSEPERGTLQKILSKIRNARVLLNLVPLPDPA